MPIKRRQAPLVEEPVQEEPSFWDRIGGLRGVGAMGARGISGILSGPGGPWGAAVSGIGEGLAQYIEGGDPFTKSGAGRVAVEAGLGAFPAGKLIKGGRFLGSAIRSGGYSGAGELAREVVESGGQSIDPLAVAGHAVGGGLIGGTVGRVFGVDEHFPRARSGPDVVIEQRGQPITTTRGTGGPYAKDRTGPALRPKRDVRPVHTDEATFQDWLSRNRPSAPETASPQILGAEARARVRAQGRDPDVESVVGVPYGAVPPEPSPGFLRADRQRMTDERVATREAERLAARQQKLAEEEEASAAIARAREGLVPEQAVSDTISAPIPGGRETLRTRYTKPDNEDGVSGSDPGVTALAEELGLSTGRTGRAGRVTTRTPLDDLPPEGTAPRGIFDAWVAQGQDAATALKFAEQGIAPRGVEIPGVPPSARRIEGPQRPPNEPEAPPTASSAPRPPSTPPAPAGREPLQTYDEPIGPRTAPRQLGTQLSSSDPDELEGIEALLSRGIDPEVIASVLGRSPSRVTGTLPQRVTASAPAPTENPVEAVAELLGVPSQPARFFKTRAGASGQAIGDIKRAQKAGETVHPEGVEAARAARTRESQALRPAPAPPAPEIPPPVRPPDPGPEPPVEIDAIKEAPDWVRENIDFLNRPGITEYLKKLKGDERGGITPEMALTLGSAAGGGLAGYAADPLDNQALSAFLGAGAGLIAPTGIKMLSQMGVPGNIMNELSVDDLKGSTVKVLNSLPQWQRFNYLADPTGLAANAVAGPYGAILTGAVEAILKGDPRGYQLLTKMNPANFVKDTAYTNVPEALSLVKRGEEGRAGHLGLDLRASPTEVVRSGPGIMMTSGDVAARSRAQAAGFTEKEAREMTLTSEPESAAFQALAHLGVRQIPEGQFDIGQFLLNTTMPFRRTPTNIAEQGLRRVPGIGSIAEGWRDTPASFRDQLVQQGMGGAIGAGNYALAENLTPEQQRIARRFSTNLAGRYSLPANMGFAAGAAAQRGQNPTLMGALEGIDDSMPLPDITVLQDWARFLSGEGPIPRGSMPRLLREELMGSSRTPGALTPLQPSRVRRIGF